MAALSSPLREEVAAWPREGMRASRPYPGVVTYQSVTGLRRVAPRSSSRTGGHRRLESTCGRDQLCSCFFCRNLIGFDSTPQLE